VLKSLAHKDWPYVGTAWEWRGYGPVYLPPAIFDAAECAGADMTGYLKQQTMPVGNETVFQKLKFGPELS
jgi:hypothetical protein